MPRLSNQEIITSLQNGDEQVLFYLSKKYYQSARKWLRRQGCRDVDTPAIFSSILVKVCREIQRNNLSKNVDFEIFLFNSIRDHLNFMKADRNNHRSLLPEEMEIISSCFGILDEISRKILATRYCENLSFEQIAVRMDYSNPVIAHFEFNKAFASYENIVRARLNVAAN